MTDNTWGELVIIVIIAVSAVAYGVFSTYDEVKESCEGSHKLEVFGNTYTCVPNPRDPR